MSHPWNTTSAPQPFPEHPSPQGLEVPEFPASYVNQLIAEVDRLRADLTEAQRALAAMEVQTVALIAENQDLYRDLAALSDGVATSGEES